MDPRIRTIRRIGIGVSAFLLLIGLLAACWLTVIARGGDSIDDAAIAATDPDVLLDVPTAWMEGRALLAEEDFIGARRLAEAMIAADSHAIAGHRLLVEWSFAAMGQATEAPVFEEAIDICLTQADWLGAGGKAVAESELIRACCANARGVWLERKSDPDQAAGHFDRARLHAEAALAADPTLEAAQELIRRLDAV